MDILEKYPNPLKRGYPLKEYSDTSQEPNLEKTRKEVSVLEYCKVANIAFREKKNPPYYFDFSNLKAVDTIGNYSQ